MPNNTQNRKTQEYGGHVPVPDLIPVPQSGGSIIFVGNLVGINATGFAIPATAAGCVAILGIATNTVNIGAYDKYDATGLADGAQVVQVDVGIFKLDNSAAGDAIGEANLGQTVYAADDHTAALTDANGTRLPIGPVIVVEADGVYVQTKFQQAALPAAGGGPKGELSFPIDLTLLANGNAITLPAMKWAGRILSAYFTVEKPVTTAAKAATLTPKIGGVAVTGAALALTSANCTPQGASVAANATAANTFNAGDILTVDASGVTTFVEGNGSLHLVLG